jgi:hypothetical protein
MQHSETKRIAEQLRLAMSGDSWAGVCVQGVLADVSAAQAAALPLENAHRIWELVLHIETYLVAARDPLAGRPMPHIYKTPADWPAVEDTSPAAWKATVARLERAGADLADAIEKLDPARLSATVPNRKYDFYCLLHGVVQHTFYHLGQIMMVKKAASL